MGDGGRGDSNIICNDSCYNVKEKLNTHIMNLLPTGSEEREVLGVGSIPVAILPSCQDLKTIAL